MNMMTKRNALNYSNEAEAREHWNRRAPLPELTDSKTPAETVEQWRLMQERYRPANYPGDPTAPAAPTPRTDGAMQRDLLLEAAAALSDATEGTAK